jgi:hypothetical protein
MGRRATASVTQQFLHQQKSTAQMGASSITSFIELASKSLVLLTKDADINLVTDNTQKRMEAFVDDWSSTPVIAILRIDSGGIRVAAASSTKQVKFEERLDKSDAVCIGWAETAHPGEICVTDVGIPSPEEEKQFGHVFGLVTPVHFNDKYNGSLVLAISFDKLAENYLNTLRITDDSIVSVIASNGNVIYSDNPEYINKNLLELLKENVFLGSSVIADRVEQILKTNEAGSEDLALPKPFNTRVLRMLVAYAPIQINDDHLMLVTRTPFSQALQAAAPFYVNNIAIVVVMLLVLLLLVVVVAKNMAYREGFIGHGKVHGEKKEKSEKEMEKIVEKK